MDEGATEQRQEKTITPRCLEAKYADSGSTTRAQRLPDAHAQQQTEYGDEEDGGWFRPSHPRKVRGTVGLKPQIDTGRNDQDETDEQEHAAQATVVHRCGLVSLYSAHDQTRPSAKPFAM